MISNPNKTIFSVQYRYSCRNIWCR